ncbi:MAG: YpdA family putative bacillithiol disulfide reductase [Chitinophagaceae bacterium]|nr:YpdA family putative bacillithiol disulfide reductase [Chitinophagaceae bacterium]
MEHQTYDIIIIGGGPIGLACGLEAKNVRLTYLILEKGTLVNSLYNYPVNMTFFSTSERLEIGGIPFVSNNAKPTRNEALEYYRRVTVSGGLHVKIFEEVLTVKESSNESFTIITNKDQYAAANIIVATGFYDIPFLLNVKGEELDKVRHYYKDPHFYAFQKVLVVGAANSAVDAALETWRKGASVTMVIKNDAISERVKYWVKPDIENRIAEGAIKAYFNSTVAEIRDREVDIKTQDGLVTIENDWVLAMTGYQPDLEFLRKLKIELSNDGIFKPTYYDETYETNVKGIYLAGVICGGMNTHRLFIENSREHAEKIIRHIKLEKAQKSI